MPHPTIRTRCLKQLAFGGRGPTLPRTSDLVLGIIATAMLGAFCLVMAANLVAGALERSG